MAVSRNTVCCLRMNLASSEMMIYQETALSESSKHIDFLNLERKKIILRN